MKTKLVDVKPSMYVDCNKENDKEGPKCEVGGRVRMLKY